MDSILSNIQNWRYSNAEQVAALSDEKLNEEYQELTDAIKSFSQNKMAITGEMFWLFIALSTERGKRKIA
jgi:NTP pyrophosphatase (non-canonical NTP hydrolase)